MLGKRRVARGFGGDVMRATTSAVATRRCATTCVPLTTHLKERRSLPLLSATGPVQERNRDVNAPAAGAHAPLAERPRGRSRLGSACRCGPDAMEETSATTRLDFPQNRAHFCRECLRRNPDVGQYTRAMEVKLSPKPADRLARAAERRGISSELLAREAIERAVDYEDWFVREVDKGLAQIEAGQVLAHEAVGVRLEQKLAHQSGR